MSLTLEEIKEKRFEFDGQSAIDIGGLTRIVHDLFFKSFINKFFVGNETKILGNKFNYEELNKATKKLIVLTEKTKIVWGHYGEETTGSINFIPIEENLLNILLADNVQEYINHNKNKNKYHIIGTFSYLNKDVRGKYGIDLINATNETNVTNETIKNYLIAFLTMNGFKSYQQYFIMRMWVQTYWKPNSSMFSNKLSFDFETFSKRVLLKFGNSPEVKLSEFRNSNVASYSSYKPFKLFLEYLRHSDEYRMNFNILVSGSSTYGGILRIIFETTESRNLYHAHTCSNEINIYNNEVGMSINDLNGAIEGEINKPNVRN